MQPPKQISRRTVTGTPVVALVLWYWVEKLYWVLCVSLIFAGHSVCENPQNTQRSHRSETHGTVLIMSTLATTKCGACAFSLSSYDTWVCKHSYTHGHATCIDMESSILPSVM